MRRAWVGFFFGSAVGFCAVALGVIAAVAISSDVGAMLGGLVEADGGRALARACMACVVAIGVCGAFAAQGSED